MDLRIINNEMKNFGYIVFTLMLLHIWFNEPLSSWEKWTLGLLGLIMFAIRFKRFEIKKSTPKVQGR